jgi:hypothetical protein
MGIGQLVRRAGLKVKKTGTWLSTSLKRDKSGAGAIDDSRIVKLSGRAAGALVLLLFLYYVGGALLMQRIDNDVNFKPSDELKQGESEAVAMAVALIEREVNKHGWTANDPFFKPTAILDNMPNYQQGMVAALARFGFELTDQLGRTRGSSQADADLQEAAGLLQYAGDKWLWDPSVSLLPTATSEQQYRKAARALQTYNDRLASGTAVFERRSDNLVATLDRIALDLGSSSAVIDAHVNEEGGWPIHRRADNIYYNIKGQMYGYYMILQALGNDFSEIIAARDLQKPYAQMLRSFELAATQEPGIILNGIPDSQAVPCHLCGQGFYLLRARTQLREITNILLK